MKNEDRHPQAESSVKLGQPLRQRAEEIAQEKEDRSSGDMVSPEEMRKKLHELLVHQIELEMQNEELRRVQAELEDARTRYVDLYDFAPVGYCTISRMGLIVESNLTAAKLLGVSRGELIHKPISRFIQKEDQDVYYLHRLKLFETGEPQEYELRMTKSDGTAFWVHLASVTLQDADGEPICRIIISVITKRKQAEEALRQSEYLLRTIIEGTTDAVYLIDRESRLIMANSATGHAVDLSVSKILGKANSEYFSDDERLKVIIENDRRIMEADKAEVVEEPAEDGVRTYLSTKTPWHDADGNVIGLIGISRDITDRKAMEEKLKQTVEELARKNKLVTEFFTNISHEFKTPLSVILIQLELMKMYVDDKKKMNEFIAAATQNSFRLTRLVGNLLDITKIDAGYLKVNFASVEIVSLIRDICESVDFYAKARSIDLKFKRMTLRKQMPTDTEKIERIMLNLLSNAIKHTGVDGTITVGVKDRKEGGVTISVEDTGEGIPPEKLGIIFDRFAQVNTSLTRNTEGSGIGLALVKSLVEMLGGNICVKSSVGYGTHFTIDLPLIEMDTQTGFIEIEGYDLRKKTAMELSDLYLEKIG